MIDRPIRSGNRQLSDKITTIHARSYKRVQAAVANCEVISGTQSDFVLAEVMHGSGYLNYFIIKL